MVLPVREWGVNLLGAIVKYGRVRHSSPPPEAAPASAVTHPCGRVAAAVDGSPIPGALLGAEPVRPFLALEPGTPAGTRSWRSPWGEYPEEKARVSLRQALTICETPLARFTSTGRRWGCPRRPTATSAIFRRRPSPRGRRSRVCISQRTSNLDTHPASTIGPMRSGTRSSDATPACSPRPFEEAIANRSRDAVRAAERWVASTDLGRRHARVDGVAFLAGNRTNALQAFDDYRSRSRTPASSRQPAGRARAARCGRT